MMKYLIATAGLVALTACSNKPGEISRSYVTEAGALVDNGEFGNANMNNTLVMTGEAGYIHTLGTRFASEVQTTVNFAFGSAKLDAGAREIFEKDRNFRRASFFPAMEGAIGARDINRICGFFELRQSRWLSVMFPSPPSLKPTEGPPNPPICRQMSPAMIGEE